MLLFAAPAAAKPMQSRHLQAISNPYPFETPCREARIFDEDARAEVEPHVAVDPVDADNVVAAWIQDFGQAVVTARSTDGGASWSVIAVDHLDACKSSQYLQFFDPWLSFGRNHAGRPVLYLNVLAAPREGGRQVLPQAAVVVLRSLDGGKTWSAPIRLNPNPADKPAITASPFEPCRAYAIWTVTGGQRQEGRAAIEFARTNDCGASWSAPRFITPDLGRPAGFSLILVHPEALLHVFLAVDQRSNAVAAAEVLSGVGLPAESGVQIMAQRSADNGETWSDPIELGQAPRWFGRDPDGQTIFAPALPTAGIGPDGTAYVAWADNQGSVLLVKSADAGQNWTQPSPVVTQEKGVFTPTLAVAPDGTVGITYFDFRHDESSQTPSLPSPPEPLPADPDGEPLTTDVWFAHADRGRTAEWDEIHVAGPFDMRTAIRRGPPPHWLGDYQGLVARGKGFAAAFAMSMPQAAVGRSDIFFARLQPGS